MVFDLFISLAIPFYVCETIISRHVLWHHDIVWSHIRLWEKCDIPICENTCNRFLPSSFFIWYISFAHPGQALAMTPHCHLAKSMSRTIPGCRWGPINDTSLQSSLQTLQSVTHHCHIAKSMLRKIPQYFVNSNWWWGWRGPYSLLWQIIWNMKLCRQLSPSCQEVGSVSGIGWTLLTLIW